MIYQYLSVDKSTSKEKESKVIKKVNVEIEVNPGKEKHVDLYLQRRVSFETLAATNNQILFKFLAPLTSFLIRECASSMQESLDDLRL